MNENTTRAARPIPLALTALVALFSALAALAFSGGMDMAQAHGNAPHHPAPAAQPGRHRERGQAVLRQGGGQCAGGAPARPHPDRG
jgi:hypothetical protein